MTARLRIPQPHKKPLARVATMTDVHFEGLQDRLRLAEGDLTRSGVVAEISDALDALDEPGLILDALVGAWTFGRMGGLTPESAASDVAESEVLELEPAERASLARRLSVLFDSPVLDVFAHAMSLIVEDEHSYCTSRILSDLRPMFGPDDDVTPAAAMIRHSLKFDLHIDGRLESVLISIDERGLNELAAGIRRAARKAESIRALAHKAGLRIIDLEETH